MGSDLGGAIENFFIGKNHDRPTGNVLNWALKVY